MPQYVRVSPQPLTEPEEMVELSGETRRVIIKVGSQSKTLRKVRELQPSVSHPFSLLLPRSVEDAAAITQLAQSVIPSIVCRKNVTLLFMGHTGAGKSCLMEQLLPLIVENLKQTVVAANEAHQELLSIGGDQAVTSVHRKRTGGHHAHVQEGNTPAGKGTAPTAAALANLQQQQQQDPALVSPTAAAEQQMLPPGVATAGGSGAIEPVASPAKLIRARSANKRQPRASSAMSRASTAYSSMNPSKYSLMMATFPRDDSIIDVSEIDLINRPVSPKPLLPDLSAPDLVRPSTADQQHKQPEEATETAETSAAMRKTLLRTRSPIGFAKVSMAHLRDRNGRDAGEHTTLRFNGEDLYLNMPWMDELDRALKLEDGLHISCWVLADDSADGQRKMTLFHFKDPADPNYAIKVQLNTNNVGAFENGSTLVTLRDAHGKSLEMAFTDNVCDGHWHFVTFMFQPLQSHILMFVDGKSLRPKIVSPERPMVFHEDREKVGYIGASMEVAEDGSESMGQFFAGFLFGFTFGDPLEGVIADFPLKPHASSAFPDSTAKVEPASPEGNLLFKTEKFVPTSPIFNGNGTHVRVGPVGDFGLQLCSNIAVEFLIRCAVTTDIMCVMGVVDQRGKHQSFSVDLHRNAQGQFQRCTVCMSLVDVHGNYVRACVDAPDMFDDRWHQVYIKLHDLSFSKFKAKIDGKHCDVYTSASSTLPENFVGFEDGMTIGCLNNRNAHTTHFKGSLRQIKISRTVDDVDEVIAHWPMEEGPGSRIAIDASDHGFAGAYFLSDKKKGAQWLPMTDASIPIAEESALATANMGPIVRHNNNIVTMAFVAVVMEITPTGHVKEHLLDLIHNTRHDLDAFCTTQTNERLNINDPRFFQTIPEECFKEILPVEFITCFKNALHKSQDYPRSHLVYVLRLGDALFTAVDVVGYTKSARATFSVSQMQWIDAISTFGSTNKINLRLNHSIAKTEKFLMQAGSHPQLFKRTQFMRRGTSTASDNMLTNIIMNAMCSGKELSECHMVHLLSPNASRDEAQNSIVLADLMDKTARTHAAVVIQKLYRYWHARKIYFSKLELHNDSEARKEKITILRKTYPAETNLKSKRHVIIANCTMFDYDNAMPSDGFGFDDCRTATKMFEQMGFTVEVLPNPSKDILLETISDRRQQFRDEFLTLYFIGYGQEDVFREYETPEQSKKWLAEVEQKARWAVYNSCVKEFHELQDDERLEFAQVEDALRTAAEEAAAKKKKKKKKDKKAAPEPPAYEPIPREPVERWVPEPLSPVQTPRVEEPEVVPEVNTNSNNRPSSGHNGNHPTRYLFLGNTTAAVTAQNTISLNELRELIIGQYPRRGEHALFLYDCVTLSTATNKSLGGFGGIASSSSESLHLNYRPGHRFPLGYYIKRCLNGCAVECVRIGKHEPPQEVNVETAFRYVLSKMGSAGKFAAASSEISWFGEYVGEVLLAPKLLTRKEERQKAKKGAGVKKSIAKIRVAVSGEVFEGYQTPILQSIAKIARITLPDLRRVSIADRFEMELMNVDFNSATRHPLMKDEFRAAFKQLLPDDRIWFDTKYAANASLLVRPIKELPAPNPDEAKKDLKHTAMTYVAGHEQRLDDIQKYVVDLVRVLNGKTLNAEGMVVESTPAAAAETTIDGAEAQSPPKTEAKEEQEEDVKKKQQRCVSYFGRFPVRRTKTMVDFYIFLADEEALRVERAARMGTSIAENASLVSVCQLAEKELQEYDLVEKLVSVEDARRQAEAKARMVAEAEARKKAEEAAAALLKKRDAVLEKIQEARSYGQLASDDVSEAVAVPLPEVFTALFDACTALGSKPAADALASSRVALCKELRENENVKCDAKMHNAMFKMLNAIQPHMQLSFVAELVASVASGLLNGNKLAPAALRAVTQILTALAKEVLQNTVSSGADLHACLALGDAYVKVMAESPGWMSAAQLNTDGYVELLAAAVSLSGNLDLLATVGTETTLNLQTIVEERGVSAEEIQDVVISKIIARSRTIVQPTSKHIYDALFSATSAVDLPWSAALKWVGAFCPPPAAEAEADEPSAAVSLPIVQSAAPMMIHLVAKAIAKAPDHPQPEVDVIANQFLCQFVDLNDPTVVNSSSATLQVVRALSTDQTPPATQAQLLTVVASTLKTLVVEQSLLKVDDVGPSLEKMIFKFPEDEKLLAACTL